MTKFFTALIILIISSTALASKPLPWQLNFQEAVSPLMQELHQFHNFLLFITGGIVVLIFFLLLYVMIRFNAKANPVPNRFSHNIVVEVAWTVIPLIILVIIAIPSFRILKMAEHTPPADMTIKVIGSQWYWSYVYPDHGKFEFDSYMIQDKDLQDGQLRLLEVDNRIIIPQGATVKFLITASDVIHSFAIPALGLKTDAVPGRTNEAWTKVDKLGVYYGQCSELCGVNHGFMPIALEVVTKEEFEQWIAKAQVKFAQRAELKLASINNALSVKSN